MVSESSCRFLQCSAAKRLDDVVREHISAPKQIIIEGTGFADCLRISAFTIPNELTEWIVMNIDHKRREFRYCNKSIVLTRDMVKKVFNVPSGVRPVELLKRGHSELRKIYSVAHRAPIARAIEILKSAPDDDDITVSRTFVLLALAIVLCPSTGDTLLLEYLESLTNMADVQEFAWDEHILETVMDKVGKFQKKSRLQLQQDMSSHNYWIGSCFQMLAMIYMDHLDFPPPRPGESNINLPRACFVSTADFEFVVSVDKNRLVLNNNVFGKRPFRPLSATPYAAAHGEAVVQPHVLIGAPYATSQGDVASVVATPTPSHIVGVGSSEGVAHGVGKERVQKAQHHASQVTSENETNQDAELQTPTSLDDWLRQSLPSSQDLEVPSHLMHLYDKDKHMFAKDVDGSLESLGQQLKTIYSKRIATLLSDVHGDSSHTVYTNEPSDITFPTPTTSTIVASAEGASNEVALPEHSHLSVVGECCGLLDVVKLVVTSNEQGDDMEKKNEKDSGTEKMCAMIATVDAHSPRSPPQYFGCPRSVAAGIWDDFPSHDIFEKDTSEHEWVHGQTISHQPSQTHGDPVCDVAPSTTIALQSTNDVLCDTIEPVKDLSRSPLTHEKKNMLKRHAKDNVSTPKMKKIRIDENVHATYNKYIAKKHKIIKPKEGEDSPPFVKIGDFFVTYQCLQASLKPRAKLDNQVMLLFIETFNIAAQPDSNKPGLKKFCFSVLMSLRLSVDPSKFKSSSCMREFKRACKKFEVTKSDMLFFPLIIDGHWVVCTINLLHKQINVFDSMKTSKSESLLSTATNNLVTNFNSVVTEAKAFNFDIGLFDQFTPIDYPQQNTLYDCGFFTILYIENWDGKIMKSFCKDMIVDFRKVLAARFIDHPLNEIDPSWVLTQ